jgi:hypothetical protein
MASHWTSQFVAGATIGTDANAILIERDKNPRVQSMTIRSRPGATDRQVFTGNIDHLIHLLLLSRFCHLQLLNFQFTG